MHPEPRTKWTIWTLPDTSAPDAAAWLAAGNSPMYMECQLGHADIETTERYYGHLEPHVRAAGAVATEQAIALAVKHR
jgi:integrase